MHLKHWLEAHDYDPTKFLCISMGTDGFGANCNLLSVSATGGWPGADLGTRYIKGGDMGKVSEYTEVVCNDCAVTVASEDDIEAARERAMPKKRNPERQDEELPLAA